MVEVRGGAEWSAHALVTHRNVRSPSFGTALPAILDAVEAVWSALRGRGFSRLDAYGDAGAERLLAELVDEWCRRLEPCVARLRVGVAYGRSRSDAWRTKRRGSGVISFRRSAAVIRQGRLGRLPLVRDPPHGHTSSDGAVPLT